MSNKIDRLYQSFREENPDLTRDEFLKTYEEYGEEAIESLSAELKKKGQPNPVVPVQISEQMSGLPMDQVDQRWESTVIPPQSNFLESDGMAGTPSTELESATGASSYTGNSNPFKIEQENTIPASTEVGNATFHKITNKSTSKKITFDFGDLEPVAALGGTSEIIQQKENTEINLDYISGDTDSAGNPISKDQQKIMYQDWESKGYGKLYEQGDRLVFATNQKGKTELAPLYQNNPNQQIPQNQEETSPFSEFLDEISLYGGVPTDEERAQMVDENYRREYLLSTKAAYWAKQNGTTFQEEYDRLNIGANLSDGEKVNIALNYLGLFEEGIKREGEGDDLAEEKKYYSQLKNDANFLTDFGDYLGGTEYSDPSFIKERSLSSQKKRKELLDEFYYYRIRKQEESLGAIEDAMKNSEALLKKYQGEKNIEAFNQEVERFNSLQSSYNSITQRAKLIQDTAKSITPFFKKVNRDIEKKENFTVKVENNEVLANITNIAAQIPLVISQKITSLIGGAGRIANMALNSQNLKDALDIMATEEINIGGVTAAGIANRVEYFKDPNGKEYKDINGTLYELKNGRIQRLKGNINRNILSSVSKDTEYNFSGLINMTAGLLTDAILTRGTMSGFSRAANYSTTLATSKKVNEVFGAGSQMAKGMSSFANIMKNPANANFAYWFTQFSQDNYIAAKEGGIESELGRNIYAISQSIGLALISQINPDINILKSIGNSNISLVNALIRNDIPTAQKAFGAIMDYGKKAGINIAKEVPEELLQQGFGDISATIVNAIGDKTISVSEIQDYKELAVGTIGSVALAAMFGGRANVNIGGENINVNQLTQPEILTLLARDKGGLEQLQESKEDVYFQSQRELVDILIEDVKTRKKYLDRIPNIESYSVSALTEVSPLLQEIEKKRTELNSVDDTFKGRIQNEITALQNQVNNLLDQDIYGETAQSQSQQEAPQGQATGAESESERAENIEEILVGNSSGIDSQRISDLESINENHKLAEDDTKRGLLEETEQRYKSGEISLSQYNAIKRANQRDVGEGVRETLGRSSGSSTTESSQPRQDNLNQNQDTEQLSLNPNAVQGQIAVSENSTENQAQNETETQNQQQQQPSTTMAPEQIGDQTNEATDISRENSQTENEVEGDDEIEAEVNNLLNIWHEAAQGNNTETDGGDGSGISGVQQQGEAQATTETTERGGSESDVEIAEPKVFEKNGYTLRVFPDGNETLTSPSGKEISKKNKNGGINANFSKNKARILGEMTNNEINEEHSKRRREALKNYTPTSEREVAMLYFANGGKVHPESVKKELSGTNASLENRGKKRSITEYKWSWLGKDAKNSFEQIAEKLADNEIQEFDIQTLRNELIDVVNSYGSSTEIAEEIVDLYNKSVDPYFGLTEEDALEMARAEMNQAQVELYSSVPTTNESLSEEDLFEYYKQQYENSIYSLTDEQQNELYGESEINPGGITSRIDQNTSDESSDIKSEGRENESQNPNTNSPEYQQLLKDRTSQEARVKSAKDKLDNVSRTTNQSFQADQENLFGERQTDGGMFDERADAEAGRNVISEAKDVYDKERAELTRINNAIRDFEVGNTSGTGEINFQISEQSQQTLPKDVLEALIEKLKQPFKKAFKNLKVIYDWNEFEKIYKDLGGVGSLENISLSKQFEDINRKFNNELNQLINGTLPKGHVFQLGKPSAILKLAGIDDLPIELEANRLERKSKQENHPFELSDLNNLSDAIQNPIAVFDSTKKDGSSIVLTEITDKNDSNYVVALKVSKKGTGRLNIEINDIKSVYPKDNFRGVIDWINSDDNLLRFADKEKALKYISVQSTNLIGNGNTEKGLNSVSQQQLSPTEITNATNVVKNFKNPNDNSEDSEIQYSVNATRKQEQGDVSSNPPVQFMYTANGEIYGAKLPDGTIYLNPERLNANTAIHEFSHLWEQIMPNAWARGLNVFKQTNSGKRLFKELKEDGNYSNLTDDQLWSEALNTHLGNYGGENWKNIKPDSAMDKLRDWFKDLLAKIGEVTGWNKMFNAKLSPETKLEIFTRGVMKDLFNGKSLTPESSFMPHQVPKLMEYMDDNELERTLTGLGLIQQGKCA